MFQFKELKKTPIWKSATDVLFSKHLSAKFAYKSRLEFTDIIKSQFYVRREGITRQKQLAEKFPVYEEILQTANDMSIPPIYLVNLVNSEPTNETDSTKKKSSGSKQLLNGRTASKQIFREPTSSHDSQIKESSSSIKFDYKSEDFFLVKYISQVQKLLKEKELIHNTQLSVNSVLPDQEIEARIHLLADYVCNQLSGPDRSTPCTSHYLGLHIEQLKNELESNLIPIGLLRAGLAIERAILFKVLADQIGLPCALVRGLCGQAWVEISLPAASSPPPFYPTTFLKPTHIVDLLHTNRLLQLGSFAANKYSTSPGLCAYDKHANLEE